MDSVLNYCNIEQIHRLDVAVVSLNGKKTNESKWKLYIDIVAQRVA